MLALQASIGALNDVMDARLDAVSKPSKPIPAGLVAPGTARWTAGLGFVASLALSAPSGAGTVVLAASMAGLGYLYDMRLSRTVLSWLPLAVALPLLPIHAWLGAAGSVPAGLFTLVPAAVLAGGSLSLANGLADIERDAAAGRRTLAVRLGRRRAWIVQSTVLAGVAAYAWIAAPGTVPGPAAGGGEGAPGEVLQVARAAGLAAGSCLLVLGAVGLAAPRAGVRERGWELEAIGVAAVGVGWIAGTAAAFVAFVGAR